MRFQLLFGWWLLLIFIIVALAAISWHLRYIWSEDLAARYLWMRRAVMVVLLLFIVLGPSVPGGTSSPGVANLDVVFAVDTTASMGANDYNGVDLRLEGAKKDMLTIGDTLKGAHFAIVTFDSKASVLLPYTTDYATFTGAVQTFNRELYNTSNGSSIDKPIDVVGKQLKNSKSAYPERLRMLFYLGDGEQTAKDKPKTFAGLSQYTDGGAVLGYGTAKGAQIFKYTGIGATASGDANSKLIMTPDPQTKKLVPAVSKLNETQLKVIAEQLNVTYKNRNSGGSTAAVVKASKAELLINRSKHVVHYLNIYWFFAIPFTVLLFWEWKTIVLTNVALYKAKQKDNHE